jgi:hypothetical protein
VRNGDHHELAAAHDLVGVEHGNAGQNRFDAVAVGAGRDADEGVSGAGERRPDDGADAPGADDPTPNLLAPLMRVLPLRRWSRSSSASGRPAARHPTGANDRSRRPRSPPSPPAATRRPHRRGRAPDGARHLPGDGVPGEVAAFCERPIGP